MGSRSGVAARGSSIRRDVPADVGTRADARSTCPDPCRPLDVEAAVSTSGRNPGKETHSIRAAGRSHDPIFAARASLDDRGQARLARGATEQDAAVPSSRRWRSSVSRRSSAARPGALVRAVCRRRAHTRRLGLSVRADASIRVWAFLRRSRTAVRIAGMTAASAGTTCRRISCTSARTGCITRSSCRAQPTVGRARRCERVSRARATVEAPFWRGKGPERAGLFLACNRPPAPPGGGSPSRARRSERTGRRPPGAATAGRSSRTSRRQAHRRGSPLDRCVRARRAAVGRRQPHQCGRRDAQHGARRRARQRAETLAGHVAAHALSARDQAPAAGRRRGRRGTRCRRRARLCFGATGRFGSARGTGGRPAPRIGAPHGRHVLSPSWTGL